MMMMMTYYSVVEAFQIIVLLYLLRLRVSADAAAAQAWPAVHSEGPNIITIIILLRSTLFITFSIVNISFP
jgi:hypothetical protein